MAKSRDSNATGPGVPPPTTPDIGNLLVNAVTEYAIILLGPDGTIMQWNSGAERILGFTAVEAVGQHISILYPEQQAATGVPAAELSEALHCERMVVEGTRCRKDSSHFPATATLTALSDDDRGHIGFALVIREDSDRVSTEQSRAEEVDRRRLLFEQAKDGIVVIDENRRVVEANPSFAAMLGYTLEEVYRMRAWEWDAVYSTQDKMLAQWPELSRDSQTAETRLRRKDGTDFDAEISWNPACWSGRRLLFCVCRDISERKQAEEIVRVSEERLRKLIEILPDALFVNTNDQIVFCNPNFLNLLGAPSEEAVLGRSPYEFIHPDYHSLVRDRIQSMKLGGAPVPTVEEQFVRLDGTLVPVEVAAAPAVFQGQSSIVVVLHDLTRRKQAEESQRHTEKRFRLMIENVRDYAIYIMDKHGLITDWNSGAERLLGYSANEIIGFPYAKFFPAEDVARGLPEDEMAKAADEGTAVGEGWRIRKDGSRLWSAGVLTALYDDFGAVRCYCRVAQDLTERRRIETMLRAVLDNALDGIIAINDRGTIETFNAAAVRMFGYTEAEVIGHNVNMLMPKSHSDRHDSYIQNYIRTGDAKVIGIGREVEGQRKDGSVFPLELAISEFETEVDGRRHFAGIVRDITQRRKSEQMLNLLQRAVQAVSQGILITDSTQHDNPIVFASDGFERLTGYVAREIIGRNCRFLQGPGTDPDTVAAIRVAVQQERPCSVEILNYCKDGTPVWVALFITPVRNPEGKVTHFVGVQADVTARRKLEDALHQSQKMEAIGQLAGGIAHDFNNLLTVISGYGEVLRTDLDGYPGACASVEAILDAGNRAAGLTKQLLAFSRQAVLEMRVVDLNAVVRETEMFLRRLIGEDISLSTALDPNIGAVRVDPSQMGQVLMNLAVNARDAMRTGGKLTIQTRSVRRGEDYISTHPEYQSGDYVVLAVADTGAGIAPEMRPRIFEPFFTTKEAGKGTGLGLAVVHGVVKQSNGHIEVYSEPGMGTTFRIYLPVAGARPVMETEAGTTASHGGTETILLVEDEEAVRKLAAFVLESKGYRILQAGNGAEALKIVDGHMEPIHLMMTDVVMPGMGGRELAETLVPRFPNMKVLYSSGYMDDAIMRHGILAEEVSFLQKPFTPSMLLRKIREVLDGTPG